MLNTYALNNRASKYIKKKFNRIAGEIDKSTIIVGVLNSPLSIFDRKSRPKII